jgi:hypothetical protein
VHALSNTDPFTEESFRMPTLVLLDGTKVALTKIGTTGYFRIGAYSNAYLCDNEQLVTSHDVVKLHNPEYNGQISSFLKGKLTLARGLTRQHPLFYEVALMGVLMPLGTGELPDWATNATSFIPFGPNDVAAMGVARGRSGMGPGDSQAMLADLALLRSSGSDVLVGLTVTVTVAPGAGVAFYNSGEIQVRGPLIKAMTVTPAMVSPGDLSALPGAPEIEEYTQEHGGLRHRRTVAALASYGDTALVKIAADETARGLHAETMLRMRTAIVESTAGRVAELVRFVSVGHRPGHRADANYASYLDSSINREGHDAYVAAVVAGADPAAAADAGKRAAVRWATQVSEAYNAFYRVAIFPPNWDA